MTEYFFNRVFPIRSQYHVVKIDKSVTLLEETDNLIAEVCLQVAFLKIMGSYARLRVRSNVFTFFEN